jgi:alkylation response protein AidB-like acyl-CoA dehydrogenase
MTLVQPKAQKEAGGSFLFQPVGRRLIFTVEQLSDEQRLMFQTAREFTEREVLPRTAELEQKSPGLMIKLLKQAGELGLLGNDVPEAYGGLGGDKATSMLLAEAVSIYSSWSATVMAHNGIGTLPIVFFGTPEQKQKYLPKLANAEWVGAYALTEPGSGSDALAAKCRASLSPDGKHYLLNGTKLFITNGGWADLYVVFAQLDGKFTAFLVERNFPGVSLGAEEHKLGLHGSSTCSVILDNAEVPVENVLGEIGRGHKIAFNILNVGRWKLGAGSLGGSKYLLGQAVAYASERKQFGKAILEMGAIRKKLARAACGIYAVESMCYRVAGLTDERLAGLGADDPLWGKKVIDAVEEYNIEASILKVAGSEMLGTLADELLQVWGGYGFLEEYPAARVFRDNRINRIFEGTNEVNRMLVPGTIVKRAMAGALPLMPAFADAQQPFEPAAIDDAAAVDSAKRATVFALGTALGKWMQALADEQEVLEALADAIIGCFALDSAFARARQADSPLHLHLARAYAAETRPKIFASLRQVLTHAGGELALLDRLEAAAPTWDVIALRETIAAHVAAQGGYRLET